MQEIGIGEHSERTQTHDCGSGADEGNRVHKAFCGAVLQIAKKSRDQRVGLAEGKQVAARKRFGFKT
jgi:hypothetical protein